MQAIGAWGIWENWKSPDGEPVRTFTIIATEPNALVAKFDNRMPVILDREKIDAWLTESDAATRQTMLDPFPAHRMDTKAASTKLNNSRYERPI